MPGGSYDPSHDLSANLDVVDGELEEIDGLLEEVRDLEELDDESGDARTFDALTEAAERAELLAETLRAIAAGEFLPTEAEAPGDDDDGEADDRRR